ncbi:hypothetical protein MHBO_002298, partial [Bonamia ostreae]
MNIEINEDEIVISSSDSYDSELYRDSDDYEALNRLTEIEREKVLNSRAESRSRHQKRKKAK